MAVLGVVLAFLVSSFVARNADVWRHLAAGRMVAQFTYPFGGDPFTYTAADRVWVNSNWLSELAFYLLYSVDQSGAVLVAVKAMAFAAAFAVLLLLRNVRYALWPWAVAATVASVGAAVHAQLRPFTFGLLLYAVFLTVLFRGNPNQSRMWRRPIVLGGIVALWANVDAFAFLAPLTVALLLIGELVQSRALPKAAAPEPDADPFPPVPPVATLARALVLTTVALLLNPTFLTAVVRDPLEAFAQLVPVECDLSIRAVFQPDPDLVRSTYTAASTGYVSKPLYGLNVNGLTTLLVAVAVVALSVIGYRQGRMSHTVLWVGIAVLPVLLHAKFLGAMLVVSVPLLAAHLNALAVRSGSPALRPQTERLLATMSQLGRVLTVTFLVVLMVLAVPGWLQPQNDDYRAYDRWVAWSVEPDEGMQRAAELLQHWRTEPVKGEALRGLRGVNTGPDFGDYAAWAAPGERTFVNSRYRLHRHELPDLVRLRQALIYTKPMADEAGLPLTTLMDQYQATYVCIGQSGTTIPVQAVIAALAELDTGDSPQRRSSGVDTLWHLDGRFAVVGRPADSGRTNSLVWNVNRLAFGRQDPIPADDDPTVQIGRPPQEDLAFEFLDRPKLPPIELDDSLIYNFYTDQRQRSITQLTQQRQFLWRAQVVPSLLVIGSGPLAFSANVAGPKPVDLWDYDYSLPILAAQAARRAVRRAPQDARAHFALALAYANDLMPELAPGENRTQSLTALTRARARLPQPITGERSRFTSLSIGVEAQLYKRHMLVSSVAEQHIDLARNTVVNLNKFASGATDDEIRRVPLLEMWQDYYTALWVELATQRQVSPNARPPAEQLIELLVQQKLLSPSDAPQQWVPSDAAKLTPALILERLKKLDAALLEIVRRRNDILDRLPAGQPPEVRFQRYIQLGLPGRAIEVLEELGDKSKQGELTTDQMTILIGLLLRVGQLEQASVYRKVLDEALARLGNNTDPRTQNLRAVQRQLEMTEAKLAGNFSKAEQLLEEQVRLYAPPKLTEAERAELTANPVDPSGAVGAVGGWWHKTFRTVRQNALKQRLFDESMYWFQRGMMALLNGDCRLAAEHFDATMRPQGIDIQAAGIAQESPVLSQFVPKYRELLQRYRPAP